MTFEKCNFDFWEKVKLSEKWTAILHFASTNQKQGRRRSSWTTAWLHSRTDERIDTFTLVITLYFSFWTNSMKLGDATVILAKNRLSKKSRKDGTPPSVAFLFERMGNLERRDCWRTDSRRNISLRHVKDLMSWRCSAIRKSWIALLECLACQKNLGSHFQWKWKFGNCKLDYYKHIYRYIYYCCRKDVTYLHITRRFTFLLQYDSLFQ